MPVFSPRRYQPAYYPLQRDSWGVRMFTAFERAVKGGLFGCRMCGNCILQETAFVCPMTCPMGLRNGLCGGASPEHCCVDPTRPCTWYKIYERAERLDRLDRLLEVNAPLDGNRVGHETWLDMLQFWRERDAGPHPIELITDREKFTAGVGRLLPRPAPARLVAGRRRVSCAGLHRARVRSWNGSCAAGAFVTTAEIAPPLTVSTKQLEKKVGLLKGKVTAANFTDNASASARMSSIASSKLCLDLGMEPVMQLQARDRSRVALESDAMGAAGLGIRNILCLSGDHQRFGPSPIGKPDQSDMDAVQVLWMLRRMRDEGKYLDGREIKQRPQFFLGAAGSPFGAPPKYEAIRAEKKINAGAQFIQTQPIFGCDHFCEWLEALDKRNLLGKVYILAGLVPLKSTPGGAFHGRQRAGRVCAARRCSSAWMPPATTRRRSRRPAWPLPWR